MPVLSDRALLDIQFLRGAIHVTRGRNRIPVWPRNKKLQRMDDPTPLPPKRVPFYIERAILRITNEKQRQLVTRLCDLMPDTMGRLWKIIQSDMVNHGYQK